jgi:transcriptional regulator with XRE-family HTH domain
MAYQFSSHPGRQPARFPNCIRQYRLRLELNQTQLASLVGRTRSAISRWERGLAFPSGRDLFRLAKALATLTESLYRDLYAPDTHEEKTTEPETP